MKIKSSRLYLWINRAAQSGDKQELLEWGLRIGDHVRSEWQKIAEQWNSTPQIVFMHLVRCIISKLCIDMYRSISAQYIEMQCFDIIHSSRISYVKKLDEILCLLNILL